MAQFLKVFIIFIREFLIEKIAKFFKSFFSYFPALTFHPIFKCFFLFYFLFFSVFFSFLFLFLIHFFKVFNWNFVKMIHNFFFLLVSFFLNNVLKVRLMTHFRQYLKILINVFVNIFLVIVNIFISLYLFTVLFNISDTWPWLIHCRVICIIILVLTIFEFIVFSIWIYLKAFSTIYIVSSLSNGKKWILFI